MSTDFQYRLQQHETAPPAGSWENIAARLNKEFYVEDHRLAEKMINDAQPVPAGLWAKISERLDQPEAEELAEQRSLPAPTAEPRQPRLESDPVPAKIIRFPFRRIAAAAVLIIGLSATWYFATNKNDTQQQFVDVPKTPAQQSSGQALIDDASATATIAATVPGFRVSKSRSQGRPGKNYSFAVARNISDDADRYTEQDIRYTSVEKAEKGLVKDLINIPTNPIRDAQGNIIMDEKLVSAPDINYVTVTGPNGEQTKISKKFLHALSYMNAGNPGEDYLGVMLQEGSLWKWLFQEWRNKLLKQPSFIPTATNFLDIMELKEMLHENF